MRHRRPPCRNLLAMHEFRRGSSPRTGNGRTCSPPAFDPMTSTSTRASPERARRDPNLIRHSTRSWRVTPSSSRRWTASGDPQNMLAFADELRSRGAGRRVLNLGGGDADTATPMGSMLFTIMAALAQMEHGIKRERVTDFINKRRESDLNLGGRPRRVTDSQIQNAVRLVKSGEPAAQVSRDLECPGQPSTDDHESSQTNREPFSTATPTTKWWFVQAGTETKCPYPPAQPTYFQGRMRRRLRKMTEGRAQKIWTSGLLPSW